MSLFHPGPQKTMKAMIKLSARPKHWHFSLFLSLSLGRSVDSFFTFFLILSRCFATEGKKYNCLLENDPRMDPLPRGEKRRDLYQFQASSDALKAPGRGGGEQGRVARFDAPFYSTCAKLRRAVSGNTAKCWYGGQGCQLILKHEHVDSWL